MADVNRGNRPLSPHLDIYRPQITSVLSILHRVTGTAMAISALLIVWWLLAGATSADSYAWINGMLTSILGKIVLILSALGFWYHFSNGIRHLLWDMGYGFELDQVERSGYITLASAVVLTIITLIIA